MKQLPNLVSVLRIILTAILFYLVGSKWFIPLYILTGLTDILDGFLARKLHCSSTFGARLDSFADLMLSLLIAVYFYRYYGNLLVYYSGYLYALLAFKLLAIGVTYVKFKKIAIIHSYGNKIIGGLIFCLPLAFNYQAQLGYLPQGILVLSALCIFDECLIAVLSKELDLNRKSFFHTL